MKVNPIYQQETKVSSRSFKLPLIIFLCNGVLALVALLNMYAMITQVRVTAEIQYSSFLSLYIFGASLEFVMLLLIVPALTSGSISGERERQTLNLLLTTHMTPKDIVLGKLFANLSTVFLLIVSSFPILSLVFIYGGVTGKDIAILLVSFLSTAILAGCVGICCSSLFKKSTLATAASYCVMSMLVFGTIALSRFWTSFQSVSKGQEAATGISRYFLLFNPAISFGTAMKDQLGNIRRSSVLWTWLGGDSKGILAQNWLWISIILQLLLAGLCLWLAICQVNPRRKRNWKG
ncbi:MAG: ABC transporter permease [Hungatella sp.]|mgnify:CR=1 FL=1|nr:ABC transporter permease [Hungatella sp.]